ncbi:GspE/PulE family protein [Winogradskyella haliclonae]|uniref:GspE/PulE family protein n=1 Tax=Winogradskyella haliclonae TaxID=2048558 RepID=UPI0016636A08|nr:GspE/PulE family protein [Winogradskyella haliclonae]
MVVDTYKIPAELTQLISSEQAYAYGVVPVSDENGVISFKSKEDSEALKQELRIVLGREVNLLKDSPKNLNKYLNLNFRKSRSKDTQSFSYSNDFLEKLLATAKNIGSSDIHFEAFETKCRVRLRLDGKLKEYFVVPIEDYPVIINKLKIKAGLDISEKRLPQDGRISVKSPTEEYDIRVSSLPTLHGEKMVLRILSKDAEHIQLEDLGFTKEELRTYQDCVKKPNGIVLISGPTGSGKTTTLYATLKLLNDEKTNILTIEDPIEYTLEGINQVQLRENIGLDFSSTLRTFLRQDPDIIMVGEIRDVKTANMAIRAALTGHLVLSTIHTNSAWATVSRLVDMGIPSFLIASTLNVSVAQRLVRKLCPDCKEEKAVNPSDFPMSFKAPEDLKLHSVAVGCTNCFYTGYNGRKAIYEIIPINTTLLKYIKANDLEIDAYLKENGIVTLKENAITLVKKGLTSLEEVYPLLNT